MPSNMNSAVNLLSAFGLTKACAEGRLNVRFGGKKMLSGERTDEIKRDSFQHHLGQKDSPAQTRGIQIFFSEQVRPYVHIDCL